MTLQVRGNSIRGIIVNSSGAFRIVGWLAPGGEGKWISAKRIAFWIGMQVAQMNGYIRFWNDYFVTSYFDSCGPRGASGVRNGSLVRLL